MSSPTPSAAVGRPDLGATLEEFDLEGSRLGFVGLKLMPVIEVAEQSANIGKIPIEQLLQESETDRASSGGYSRGSYTFNDFYYATKEQGREEPVDDRLARIYRRYFDAEVVATKRARDVVLRNHERRVTTKLTTTGSYTNAAATTLWSTAATATPVTDVLTRMKAVRLACGMIPNTVVMEWEAFLACIETAQVIDRLKYAGYDDPKNIGPNALAQVFKVEQVLVAGGMRNTANEAKTFSGAGIWDKTKVGVGYVARTNDPAEPCVGRTFHWSADGSDIGAVIETYRDESRRCDVVRARMDTDEKGMYDECWQIITGAL